MNVLLTGAASGIGKAILEIFIKNNHKVYCIDINQINDESNVKSFVANINNQEQLDLIKDYLLQNNIFLDVIINVAGIHKMASLVESDFKMMNNLININLIGTMRINKTFHSLLNKNGKIVILTSEVAGFDPMPFNGLYNISKTALDCYAQALRQELNLLNQKVITIRPGAVKTPLSDNSVDDIDALAKQTKLYKKQASNFSNIALKFMVKPIKTSKVAKLTYKVVNKKRVKAIYNIHHNLGLVLLNLLPKKTQCFIIKLLLNR